MLIEAIDEYNGDGHLMFACNFIGAFARGRTAKEAIGKFPKEIERYCRWRGVRPAGEYTVKITERKKSDLQISDADSDVIFESERTPILADEYAALRALALKSAADFETLYQSIPIKNKALVPCRKSFYGNIPSTASEMYAHTKNVNDYYFGEIGVAATNEPSILDCRVMAFEQLEKQPDYLQNTVFDGSFGEEWSLRKVCRRFVWHDRIHAKAMARAAAKMFGKENITDPFGFLDS